MKMHYDFGWPCTGRFWQKNEMQFTLRLRDVTCANCRKRLKLKPL